MKLTTLLSLSGLVATTAVVAQSVSFSGAISKDPIGTPNAYPLVSGTYSFNFDTVSGAVSGSGSGKTFSTSVVKPGPAPVYAISTVAIFQGATKVYEFAPGAPTTSSLDASAGTKTRTQANYAFNFNTTLQGNTTYRFEFLQSGTKIASGPDFTTPALVPEPETYAAAAALGLVGFGLWRRRNA